VFGGLLLNCRTVKISYRSPFYCRKFLILGAELSQSRARILTNPRRTGKEQRTANFNRLIFSVALGLRMNFGLRAKLGTCLVAASVLFFPIMQSGSGTAFAEEQPIAAKKKAKPLPAAQVTGKVTTETEIVTGKNNLPMLTENSAAILQAVLSKYADIAANGGFPKVPKGTYKKGAKNKNVVALNQRLFMDGYIRKEAVSPDFADRVTSATVDAVTRYQRNMGLAATGVVDGPTLAAMNVPVAERMRTMEANMARLETYGQDLGDRYLIVNVPSQQIEAINNGRVFSRHNAIVGRPERPTPVVMTALSDVNFNPYWNSPASIVENDLIPKLKSGTRILEDMNIRVFQGFGGPEIDPKDVDWGSAVADDYHFRQEPGPANAMATAKINFPSPFGIYLHDTPEKHLFKSAQRFYSSGCVRVEKVEVLLEWILNGQEGIGASEIGALAETLERRDVKLEIPPQLRVTYLTAWPVGNTVAFRSDIYGLDGTDFIIGQPLPEGEVSDEGQRYVLKPIPRTAKAVEAAEAEGIGLFGKKFSKSIAPTRNKKPNIYEDDEDGTGVVVVSNARKPDKKLPFEVKKPIVAADKKKLSKGKDVPGLFDWAAYRKEQKLKGKKPAVVVEKPKKKIAAKKTETEVAAVVDKDKAKTVKKPEVAAVKKVAAVNPKAVKKVAAEPAKKPAVVEKKKPAEPVKKVAVACKPDAAGKLPKDCQAPAAKSP
jgi:L,D-transpeptidase YcbB